MGEGLAPTSKTDPEQAGPSVQQMRQEPDRSNRAKAEAAIAQLAAYGQTWPDNSPNWKWVTLAA